MVARRYSVAEILSRCSLSQLADDFLSPSTANTFRNYVRSRAAELSARAEAQQATGAAREWQDPPQLRSMKQAAVGGVIRHSIAKVKEGELDNFLSWAEQNLHKAYVHEGFRSAKLILHREKNLVENISSWTSDLAIAQNSHLPIYRSTMQELGSFCTGVPEVETKQVVLEIQGPSVAVGGESIATSFESPMNSATTAAFTSRSVGASGTTPKKAPLFSNVTRENASGVDYSY